MEIISSVVVISSVAARAGGGRLVLVRLMMGVVNDGARLVHGRPAEMRAVIGGVVFGARRRPLARPARARAGKRDDRGQHRAEQRQKDDGLVHLCP